MTKRELTKEEKKEVETNTKKAKKDLFLEYAPYLIIILFIVTIRTFIATPVKVNGSSMDPTLKNGDIMLLYKLTKKYRGLRRFDIVVIDTDSGRLIKRVIGLPGEKIKYEVKKNEEGEKVATLYINGKEVEEPFISDDLRVKTCDFKTDICETTVEIGEDEYFVMGDNRGVSKDSRLIGTININEISGTTKLVLFPFNKIGNVK